MHLHKNEMFAALSPAIISLLFRQTILPFPFTTGQHVLRFCLAKTGLPDSAIVGEKPKFIL
jgi:hypothetical protein